MIALSLAGMFVTLVVGFVNGMAIERKFPGATKR